MVNLPCVLGEEELKTLRPYLKLAEYLGKLYYQLEKAPVERIELIYSGEIARKEVSMVTRAFMKGLLTPVLGDDVNMVNAAWIAENRGIQVFEHRDYDSKSGYVSLITAKIAGNGARAEYAGTIAWDNRPRIVQVNKYKMDIILHHTCSLWTHRPAWVIGPFASILGQQNINIAMMQVGRCQPGEEALMTLSVDSPVDEATLERLRTVGGILNVKVVSL